MKLASNSMKKFAASLVLSTVTALALPAVAFAHVVVTPAQVEAGERVLFTLGVPNEKEADVTAIKLEVPAGVEDVQPNVTGGWNITTTANSDKNVQSITWTGTIPAGQRADLAFKAQAPAQSGELTWKASQTYSDGTVVRWNQKPSAHPKDDDAATAGPYSVTEVKSSSSTPTTSNKSDVSSNAALALIFSVVALVTSIGAWLRRQKSS